MKIFYTILIQSHIQSCNKKILIYIYITRSTYIVPLT